MYDIYLLQLGFLPVAVVGKLVQKWETVKCRRRNNTQNNTKAQNTQNRKQNIQNKKTDLKRILRNISRAVCK
jgi:uncharacterized membrane protein